MTILWPGEWGQKTGRWFVFTRFIDVRTGTLTLWVKVELRYLKPFDETRHNRTITQADRNRADNGKGKGP